MKTLLKSFLRDEDGAALVEYGIALLVVILVGTGALIGLAGDTSALFTDAATAADCAANATPTGAPAGC